MIYKPHIYAVLVCILTVTKRSFIQYFLLLLLVFTSYYTDQNVKLKHNFQNLVLSMMNHKNSFVKYLLLHLQICNLLRDLENCNGTSPLLLNFHHLKWIISRELLVNWNWRFNEGIYSFPWKANPHSTILNVVLKKNTTEQLNSLLFKTCL